MVKEEDKVDNMPDNQDAIEDAAEDTAEDTAEEVAKDADEDEVAAEDVAEDEDEVATEDVAEDEGEVATEDVAEDEDEVAADDVAEDEDDDTAENEAEDEVVEEGRGKSALFLIDSAYNGLLPITLLAALVGLILGPIPAIVSVLIGGSAFYPFFIAAPLLMYFVNSLLKGGRDFRSFITIAVFSLFSAYLTALSCRAALYVTLRNLSVFRIPEFVAMAFGRPYALPPSASAYAYPLIFTALGVILAAELLRSPTRGEWRRVESGELKEESQEAEGQDAEGQEVENQEAEDQEAENQEVEGQEAEDQEAEGQEVEGQETDDQEAEDQDAEGQDADDQEAEDQKAEAGEPEV